MLTIMLAQAVDIPPGAVAGWSSFGIAGLILAWLFFFHLPNKDKQLAELIAHKDEQIDEQRKEFTATLKEMVHEFKEESARERAACERHFAALADTMHKSFEAQQKSMETLGSQLKTHSERNQQWIEALKLELQNKSKELEAARREARA